MWKVKEELATGQNLCLFVDEMITEMCEYFCDKYFWEDADMNLVWMSGYVEWLMVWPLFVNDYFFTIDDVYTALRFDIPFDCLLKWYDTADEKWYHSVNLKNFYLYRYNKHASKDSKKEEKNGYWSTITERPYQRPKWWISQWPTAIWPFVWDYPYSPDWYKPTITFCNTTECRSVKFSCDDDSDDESAMRDDEDDGWENEKIRRAPNKSCWRWSCKRAWSCRSSKWGKCSKLQQGNRGRIRWDNK